MSKVFTPPTAPTQPMTTGNTAHPGYSLFKHYRPYDAGLNLWIVGSSVVTEQPDTYDLALLGSHITPVTTAQAAILTAAGYGSYVTTITDPVYTPLSSPSPPGYDSHLPPAQGLGSAYWDVYDTAFL